MNEHEPRRKEKPPPKPCALLWDESFLWGLMARQALNEAGLPFDLLRSADIRDGALEGYRMLFVPGGWAANKLSALGEKGAAEIRRFVAGGGSYLGICGGAGLATEDGLGLLPVRRKSQAERVPSFSGSIALSCSGHRIWSDVKTPVFYAWWPSQFCVHDPEVRILATYGEAGADAWSSDIPVADGKIIGWPELERRYGILLDPSRLRGEPAVMEGRFGRGKVILSLIHFDTPKEKESARVMQNIWSYLAAMETSPHHQAPAGRETRPRIPEMTPNFIAGMNDVESAVAELIAVGERNFLWSWRNPLLLQWRRGIRGLEYSTLAAMIGHLLKYLELPEEPSCDCPPPAGPLEAAAIERQVTKLRQEIKPFAQKSIALLIRERFYLAKSPLSPLVCSDESITRLRNELFGPAMSHGGHFKRLIDLIDQILFPFISQPR